MKNLSPRQKINETLHKLKKLGGASSIDPARLPLPQDIPGINIKLLMETDFTDDLKTLKELIESPINEELNPSLRATLKHYRTIIMDFNAYAQSVSSVIKRINGRVNSLQEALLVTKAPLELIYSTMKNEGYSFVEISSYDNNCLEQLNKHPLARPEFLDSEDDRTIIYRLTKELMNS